MSYNPRRVGYSSPESEDTVPLRKLSLPDYRNYQYNGLEPPSSPASYEPCASPSIYDLEKSPFADTIEQEAKVGRRPTSQSTAMARRQTHHRMSWEESWDQAVKVGRWPRIIYAVIGVLFVIVWMIVTYAFDRSELQYQTDNMDEERQSVAASALLWTLQGALKTFDPVARTLTVNWSPMLVEQDGSLSPFGTSPNNNTTYEFGIFRDQSLILDTPAHLAQINSTHPELSPYAGLAIDNSSAVPIAVVGRHAWDDFTTDIDLGQMYTGHAWLTPAFGYPLDKWSGSIVFVGNYYSPARVANLSTSFGISIDGAYLVDSIMNWRISADTNNTCSTPVTDDTWCQLQINFTARRPGLVITATIIAVVVNWLSAIFIFIMTCEGVILRRTKVIESSQLLGICFTALFALPSVRSILPGAPEFGCLSEYLYMTLEAIYLTAHAASRFPRNTVDLVGIIPNVVIVSLCTTMVAISTLRTMVDNHKRRVTMMKYNRIGVTS